MFFFSVFLLFSLSFQHFLSPYFPSSYKAYFYYVVIILLWTISAPIKHSVSLCNEKCDYQPMARFPVNQTNFWENSVCFLFSCCPIMFCYTSSHVLRWFQSPSSCLSSFGHFVIPPLKTSLICILLLASRNVHFDKRMICFLSDLL